MKENKYLFYNDYFKNMNVAGYAMIRPILGQDDIESSSRKLKKIIENNK